MRYPKVGDRVRIVDHTRWDGATGTISSITDGIVEVVMDKMNCCPALLTTMAVPRRVTNRGFCFIDEKFEYMSLESNMEIFEEVAGL